MRQFFSDIRKYHNYEIRAAKSQLKAEVAGSYLNWIWWILTPLFEMVIYYIVFGYIFKSKEPNFIAFIFVGLTLWGFFNKTARHSVNLIKKNRPIIAKVYVPKHVLLITDMMISGFKMMISIVLLFIMLFIVRVEFTWYALAAIPIMLVLLLFTFGVSINLMHYGVIVEDLSNMTDLFLRLWFFLSGIFYSLETRLGESHPEIAAFLTNWNPMAMLLHDMRNVLLYGEGPNWFGLLIWGVVSVILAVVGIKTIYKYENEYVKLI
ncbi:MAG: polysaccharide ABC transporter [Lachnospiraceae bacterium]|nr:polysaccharide ABC transporter [Lachnospiraceae bacterium]